MGYFLPTTDDAIGSSHQNPLPPDGKCSISGHRFYSPEIGRWTSRDPIMDNGNILIRVMGHMQLARQLQHLAAHGPTPLRKVVLHPGSDSRVVDYGFVLNRPVGIYDVLGLDHPDTLCPPVSDDARICKNGKKQSSTSQTSNGCGSKTFPVPDNPMHLPGCSFTSACDYHDCCYGTCGSGKLACDWGFYVRMLAQCNICGDIYGNLAKDDCEKYAKTYYGAVTVVAWGPWDSAQSSACESCCPIQAPPYFYGYPVDTIPFPD